MNKSTWLLCSRNQSTMSAPFAQKQQLVELLVQPRRGLVNGRDDGAPAGRKLAQRCEQVHRRRRVQTTARVTLIINS